MLVALLSSRIASARDGRCCAATIDATRPSVHYLWRLIQESVVDQLLEHELRQIGPRELRYNGPRSQPLTAAVRAGVRSIGEHRWAGDDPIQVALSNHALV